MYMKTTPLVSIVIPTYNRKELLIEAVSSCIKQEYKNIEIIIIDDGSSDGTESVVENMLNTKWQEYKIKYFKQKNSGASAARNFGIQKAKGKYIQFLDSDDILFPEKLKLQVSKLEDNIESEVCSCYGLIGENLENTTRIGIKCNTPKEYIVKLCSRIVHGMQTSAPLWKREFVSKQNGWRTDINLGDDLEYHIRLLTKVKQIEFIEKELFWIREHSNERLSVVNKNINKILSAIKTKQSIYEILKKNTLIDENLQKTLLSSTTTLYSNILEYGANKDILEFENWLTEISNKPRKIPLYYILIKIRRIFGVNFVLNTHKFITTFKR